MIYRQASQLLSKERCALYIKIASAFWFFFFCYSYSPYKIEFMGYYHKIWAHQVNSIPKLTAALQHYDGVEVDLFYNAKEDYFDVTHEFSNSIGLHFEQYIAKLDKENQPYLWLDMKNLTSDNAAIILEKLEKIFTKKELSLGKILIEGQHPEALPIFAKAGFMTSYYLPNSLSKMNKEELRKSLDKIRHTIEEQPNVAISTSHHNYEIIYTHFPNQKKYIWALVYLINKDFLLTKRILKDPTVKKVLVNYKAPTGNR